MWKWNKEEEEAIQYAIAIIMILFGMVLCMMGFWVSPVGELSNSVLAVLGLILVFVGAIFHINLNYRSKESNYETRVEQRFKDIEDKLK